MVKNKLIIFGFFLLFAFLLSGCPQNKKNGNTDNNKSPEQDTESTKPSLLNIEKMEFAFIRENATEEDYASLPAFNVNKAEPYEIREDAKTAYIAFKVTVDKETLKIDREINKPYSVTVENKNAYINAVNLRKGGGANERIATGRIALAKGKNKLEITAKSGDQKIIKTYTVIVNYKGGPDFSNPKAPKPKTLIKGIYCPAQRKPEEGETETEPYLWLISIGGTCTSCPIALNAVGPDKHDIEKNEIKEGEGENLAQSFKDRGLLVVVIEDNQSLFHNEQGAVDKWNTSGRGYNMYSSEHNCLYHYCHGKTTFPNMHFISKGEKKGEVLGVAFSSGTSLIEQYFGLK